MLNGYTPALVGGFNTSSFDVFPVTIGFSSGSVLIALRNISSSAKSGYVVSVLVVYSKSEFLNDK